jgi:hypothetical protein
MKEVERAVDGDVPVLDGCQWAPVGRTWSQWAASVGDHVAHEGTLLRTARGVFKALLAGSWYYGEKLEDGSVVCSGEAGVWPDSGEPRVEPTEVIIEYADPPSGYPNGCHRLPNGAIRCLCPDDY